MSLPLSKNPSLVKERFVKIGDLLVVYPVYGRKRTIKLNRKSLLIHERVGQVAHTVYQLSIPSTKEENNTYELNLHDVEGIEHFSIKVLKGDAFKLNGQWVREAYLFNGDELIIGLNKIKFESLDQGTKEDKQLTDYNPNLTLLIEGETGTGKSTLAKNLHDLHNPLGNFVHINISSFPANLIESELFGHVKGAFTGAISEKQGAIRSANNGTLFIDEIDSLPIDLQVKLLLFLDHQKIRQVGSDIEIQCNVNLIFASGQKLEDLIEKKLMRRDFYFRISSGQKIYLESLHKNKNKILKICHDFEVENEVYIPKDVLSFYKEYLWPGNIRQLKSHLEKKKFLSKSRVISLNHEDYDLLNLNNIFSQKLDFSSFGNFKKIKHDYFLAAFYECGQSYAVTAKKLGVSVASIKNSLSKVS